MIVPKYNLISFVTTKHVHLWSCVTNLGPLLCYSSHLGGGKLTLNTYTIHKVTCPLPVFMTLFTPVPNASPIILLITTKSSSSSTSITSDGVRKLFSILDHVHQIATSTDQSIPLLHKESLQSTSLLLQSSRQIPPRLQM